MFLQQEHIRLPSKKINNLIFYNTVLKFNDFATVFCLISVPWLVFLSISNLLRGKMLDQVKIITIENEAHQKFTLEKKNILELLK